MTLLNQAPSDSVITQETRLVIEESLVQILNKAGCQNVWPEEMEPVTTWELFQTYIATHDDTDNETSEAWFISRTGFRHDPLTRGTWNHYEKSHRMSIHGVVWKRTFGESYRFMQKQAEINGRWLERNKGGLSESISEFSDIVVDFSSQTMGESYLYHSMTSLSVLMGERETGGRK